MNEIPQASADLIKALDARETVGLENIEDMLTEKGRLEHAKKIGRRELVNELKLILNRKD